MTYKVSLTLLLAVVIALPCLAATSRDNRCNVAPGTTTIVIPLQNGNNAYEPACVPGRVRVLDRQAVTVHLTGLSPIDLCLPASKTPTLTTVTNPIESIINSVTGLKAFDFSSALTSSNGISALEAKSFLPEDLTPDARKDAAKKRETDARASLTDLNDQAAFDRFVELSDGIVGQGTKVYDLQQSWAAKYVKDLQTMADYLAPGKYRMQDYEKFTPETTLALIRADTQLPGTAGATPGIPSELDWAPLQAVVDQLKNLQTRLITTCTTAKQQCNLSLLEFLDKRVDQANAVVQNAQDNLKILAADQAAVLTAYQLIDKIYNDYQTRLNTLHSITPVNGVLTQDIRLPSDYGETDPFTFSCVNDATTTSATTDAINVSILYQNVPAFTATAGLLLSTLNLQQIGVEQELVSGVTTPYFAVTQSSPLEVVPMAYVNYRFLAPKLTTWWGQPENELVRAHSVSGGIGINSNSGTNQPEFFAGYALSFSRVYLHFGADFARNETLGGGFTLNKPTPSGFTGTTAPIDWKYQTVFGFGLSVRVAPF